FFFRPRSRCDPANPSDDGGLEEVVEFCCRRPSLRSRSAICFSASLSCRFFSISSSRNLSLSRLSRSISRSTFRWFSAGGIDGRWRCEAPKHLHCQVFHTKARPKSQILKDLCDATFAGPELLHVIPPPGMVTTFDAVNVPKSPVEPCTKRPSTPCGGAGLRANVAVPLITSPDL